MCHVIYDKGDVRRATQSRWDQSGWQAPKTKALTSSDGRLLIGHVTK